MKKRFIIPIASIFIALSFNSCKKDDDTASTNSITTVEELTSALNEIYDDSKAPGFAVSVVKNDVVLYQKAFGFADIDANKSYTNKTTQPIGSVSKTFIGAAIVKAIDQGYFTLETEINDILPVEIQNPKQPDNAIKVKHLVTHTSGLLDQTESYFKAYHILPGENLSTPGSDILQNAFGFEQRTTILLEDFLAEYYLADGDYYSQDNFASYKSGTVWNYSNIASSLSAYLIEKATGIPFKQYVKTNVFQPLNMNESAYDVKNLNAEHVSKLFWDKNTPLPLYSNDSYPDGGINTSNEDFAKYLLDMIRGSQGNSNTLFSKQGYDLLFKSLLPSSKVPQNLGQNQGVFWFLDGNIIKHDGSDPGTTCELIFDKTDNSGYTLMTNMDASSSDNQNDFFKLSGKIRNVISEFVQGQ